MHHLLHLIESESEYYNLKLNKSECVVMDIDGKSSIHFKNLEELKKEQNAKYLGGIINSEARRQEEINNRIKDTYTVFNKLKIFWRNPPAPVMKLRCSPKIHIRHTHTHNTHRGREREREKRREIGREKYETFQL